MEELSAKDSCLALTPGYSATTTNNSSLAVFWMLFRTPTVSVYRIYIENTELKSATFRSGSEVSQAAMTLCPNVLLFSSGQLQHTFHECLELQSPPNHCAYTGCCWTKSVILGVVVWYSISNVIHHLMLWPFYKAMTPVIVPCLTLI